MYYFSKSLKGFSYIFYYFHQFFNVVFIICYLVLALLFILYDQGFDRENNTLFGSKDNILERAKAKSNDNIGKDLDNVFADGILENKFEVFEITCIAAAGVYIAIMVIMKKSKRLLKDTFKKSDKEYGSVNYANVSNIKKMLLYFLSAEVIRVVMGFICSNILKYNLFFKTTLVDFIVTIVLSIMLLFFFAKAGDYLKDQEMEM